MSLIIQWFRQDLRISDNPALFAAANKGEVLPIYILDDDNAGKYKIGSASRIWLHHSLEKLNESLEHKLRIFAGDAKEVTYRNTISRQYIGIVVMNLGGSNVIKLSKKC